MTIKILPEILSNQIAAGEVVQRPSSVVKELVENSIDARATQITIEIEKGGKSLIRVSDNGIGLSRDDALLSMERYATSKIFTKEDLFSISTMGFRGEALPSIASVSKFTLVTKTGKSDIGTKIDIAGGRILNVSDYGAPAGTMVEVKNLFFNTPARKKFLKSDNTELSHIADTISGMALGYSKIQFRLFFNQQLQKNFSSSHDLFQRAVNVLGKSVVNKIYDLHYIDNDLKIMGFCVHPMVTRSSSTKMFLFVNNRLIYDRGLISAVFQGYKGQLMKGSFPMAVLFVDLPFNQVDVNVHPSKREIKFFSPQSVYHSVSQAVTKALAHAQKNYTEYAKPGCLKPGHMKVALPPVNEAFHGSFKRLDPPIAEQAAFEWKPHPFIHKIEEPVFPSPTRAPEPVDSISKTSVSRIIGQVMGTYVLVEEDHDLILMDQHAAHERVVYEALKKRQTFLGIVSQELLIPETMELSFKESDVLLSILLNLASFGFSIEPFGGTTFVIKAVPAIIDEKEVEPVIRKIIEAAIENKNTDCKGKWLEDCLILMACHSAIRANKPMTEAEMIQLFHDLKNCETPWHCPHGRPTMISWGRAELEKLFKRTL